jgi:hypothetical protein
MSELTMSPADSCKGLKKMVEMALDPFEEILSYMNTLHKAKDSDYADNIPYGNFIESFRVGVPPYMGAFIRLQDKYRRCCTLMRGKPASVSDESLDDTLVDLANYAIIVLILRHLKSARPEENPFLIRRKENYE